MNSAKINVYSSLSGCYFLPDENLKYLTDQLLHSFSMWIPEAIEPVECMLNDLSDDFMELKRDYSRLFLGPFEVLAPPCGSVYLNPGKKTLMDESTFQVEQIYRQAGLEANDSNNPADHITAELEFMHYLYYQEQSALNSGNEAQADLFKQYRQSFFNQHLGEWGFEFAGKVEQYAQKDFYRNLGLVTGIVLSAEAEYFSTAELRKFKA